MSTSEIFLLAMIAIYTLPYLIWRVGNTEYYAPLVVVQIVCGILLGPGILGAKYPELYHFVFKPEVIQSLNGIAWWAVMIFVWIAGIELDLKQAWANRVETGITAVFALGTPLLLGSLVAFGLLTIPGWIGPHADEWQFVVGVGMSCAVTALPILILFMEKLEILRLPIGQRILRYASVDDIAIWGVLAMILMDWNRLGYQALFLFGYGVSATGLRKLMVWLPPADRWYVSLIWLPICGFAADWAGLHFMVGAFLAGIVLDSDWFDQARMDSLRHYVLLIIMPVFFLSTGLRTNWQMGGASVFLVAGALLLACVVGKLLGTHLAGRLLKWEPGESYLIGWLLQTKALIMIIFANVLLDKFVITNETFTALVLMGIGSTVLTVPMAAPMLNRIRSGISKYA
ncbi:MAG: cation:proton antiporter [Gammaproteobacteria bacterium]